MIYFTLKPKKRKWDIYLICSNNIINLNIPACSGVLPAAGSGIYKSSTEMRGL